MHINTSNTPVVPDKIKILNETEWKIAHRSDGCSFIGVPYLCFGEVKHGWVIGPMDQNSAEWLLDAIQQKQKSS